MACRSAILVILNRPRLLLTQTYEHDETRVGVTALDGDTANVGADAEDAEGQQVRQSLSDGRCDRRLDADLPRDVQQLPVPARLSTTMTKRLRQNAGLKT